MLGLPRRFWVLVFVPAGLVTLGTLGYLLIEDEYTFLDAVYMTVVTLSTIGYGETKPLSDTGRIFTICLILGGVFSIAYSAAEVIRSVVSGEIATFLGKQKMERALANLHDHIIVCGYGRMGRLVCKEFSRLHKPFVIIDRTESEFKDFHLTSGISLVGDATSDLVLKQAGVDRAHSLVTVLESDADNLFTTMSARLLNPKLLIVARVEDMQSEEKLIRAGANRVVSPYQIGGTRVAHAVLKPTVVDFIELTTRTEHIELQMEEAKIHPSSPLAGKHLHQARLTTDYQVIVVAIKKASGHMLFNPPADTLIGAGDILVAIGSRDRLAAFGALADPAG